MCGIVYNYNFDGSSASNRVLKQYRRQDHRGKTSYGFALPDKHINNWKVKYEDIARALRRTINPEILFHHRLSTSTEDRVTACHPFSTKDTFANEFVGVHNGMLWNEHELYELHKTRFGIRYVSDNGKDFNDSEAYVYDLASYFSGLIDGIEMEGYGAFIVVEYDKETHERIRLHWGTTDEVSAPLRVHHTKNHLDITSEGKGWKVDKDIHFVYEYATGDITSSELKHSANKVRTKYSPYYNDYDGAYPYSSTYSGTASGVPNFHEDDYLDLDEDEEVISELNRLYPSRQHYGWSMYSDGCCEACDDVRADEYLPVITQAPSHDTKARTRKAIEAVIVDRVLAKQSA